MKKIPLLISIPHGGTETPVELSGRIRIRRKDLFDDMDPYTREIYDIGPRAAKIIAAAVARAFIDLNRSTDDLPPRNPDGIIKSMTCYKRPVYIIGKEPADNLRQELIRRYYLPYHREIRETIGRDKKIQFALDCHSMAAEPPPIAPDADEKGKNKRPLICLGNVHGKSCDMGIVEKLAACFCKAFSLDQEDVSLNQPFAGGYITRTYGNKPAPWIQVEMNRSLYLSSPWFNPTTLQVDSHRLKELNAMFQRTLEYFFAL
jgi:formiminoglutamase